MRRIGYRRLLPVANVVLYTVLIVLGYTKPYLVRTVEHDVVTNVAWQEGTVEWDPAYVDYYVPNIHRLAYAINLPAYVPGSILGAAIERTFKLWRISSVWLFENVVISVVTGLFVPVLWYRFGLWLDRLLGSVPPRHFSISLWAKLFRISSAVVSALMIVGYVAMLVYGTLLMWRAHDLQFPSFPEFIILLLCLCWTVALVLITTKNLVDARRQAVCRVT